MNVFVQMSHALWDIDAYRQFIKRKLSKAIGYAIIVCLILTVYLTVASQYYLLSQTGGLANMIDNYVPNFSIENGQFSCDQVIHEQDIDAGYYIDVDSSKDWDASSSDTKTLLRNYSSVVIVDGTKMIVKSDTSTQTVWFSELDDASFNRNSIKKILPFLYVVFVIIMFVSMLVYSIIEFFMTAMILAIVGKIISAIVRIKITFKKVFIMALYACSWPLILLTIINRMVLIPWVYAWILIASSIYMGMVFARIRHEAEYMYQNPENQSTGNQWTGNQWTGNQGTEYQNTVYHNSNSAPDFNQTTEKSLNDGENLKPSDGWSFGSSGDNNKDE